MIGVNGHPNPPEDRLTPASTSFGQLAGIGLTTGGFLNDDSGGWMGRLTLPVASPDVAADVT